MRFALTDDHLALRDAVRDLLAKECPPSVVRAAWEDGPVDRGVWDALAGMGVLDTLVPEADGGLGFDETHLVPILEECGRVALPHPIVETAMVAAPLLGAGSAMVATDLGGPNIPWATDADFVLVQVDSTLRRLDADTEPTANPPGSAMDDRRPATVFPCTSPGVGVDRARRLGRVDGDLSDLGDLSGLPVVTDDAGVIERARDRGALGTAAFLVGLGQAMLDMTVDYVKQRHQFGKPVGSFQAVKHHLADAALGLEFARPAVWQAAWSVSHDDPHAPRDVSLAKVLATEAAERAGRKALQCHGAIGYTVEADLHLYLKRTWALARAWGDTAHHTDRVADSLGAIHA